MKNETGFYVWFEIVSLKKELMALVMDMRDETEDSLPREKIAGRAMKLVKSIAQIEEMCSEVN